MSTIIRWNPIREMAVMQNALDRLFEEAWSGARSNTAVSTLPLDVYENDAAYMVSASVPGLTADQIQVNFHDGVLTIAGEIPQETREDARAILLERTFGKFQRSVRLPLAVSIDNIEASLENGILKLTLPKTPEVQPRQIPVRVGSTVISNN
ncbi:MAG: Hsp20/alpha crystallin family protein [Anaerolineae bacterium]|nr:Hsp20/alpha crystallin family protein [Anaerolineae bacterium]NUQ02880.1 Hsp20/alpha crystallin family protein [Anaerolineae bacterium]